MTIENYNKWNIILGWTAFAIALITYSLTLEPTVSAWDVGEYIATSVKLEVGHPPGAPLFQMLGAFFAMFTKDASQIAKMVNFMSALASAFTILFMFWTISNLALKLSAKTGNISKGKRIAVLGSSLVGSLTYTFSDSFWFSAVEGEVYAMSSFLMALLFWLGLKWESELDTPRGNKWLVLISFVTGLSFGVHILSLLVIPAIVMLYFFKTSKNTNLKTSSLATIFSVFVLILVFKFIFPFTLKFFSASELFFINTVGLPFNSGSIIAGLILISLFYVGLNYTRKKDKLTANTLILSLLFIMIGFSSWMMLPIRANANTTINENNPSSARELLAYYEREQYGDANVFYDTYYSNKY
ncbi:glycosyltransferase family 117 protein, partial [Polaribacter sp.]|uniref:glycosyltransferase family 117 protein n=1 Tax=Polaribacter sp. TaxID=1920175 RepID=UPI003F699A0B